MSWTESGPISTPPRSTVTFVAFLLAVAALAGVGYGVHGVLRGGGSSGVGSGDQARDSQAVVARPLVDIPAVEQPPVAANTAPASANATANKDEDEADANTIAAKTAAAQAVQSKPADQPPDIDQMMTSPSEKPQAPAKPTTDEGAPGGPNNSVPF